jgi:hypothetical protein
MSTTLICDEVVTVSTSETGSKYPLMHRQESLQLARWRSEEWAKRVARIYCLEIGDDDEEEKTG